MNKAEENARRAYPADMRELIRYDHTTEFVDANNRDRGIYIEGYEQALDDMRGYLKRRVLEFNRVLRARGTVRTEIIVAQLQATRETYRYLLSFIDEQSK